MKQAVILSFLLASCVSVPHDAGVDELQKVLEQRGGVAVRVADQPASADDEGVAAMLEGDLTAGEAVAIATANNPRLQATLAELGIARAELLDASTISNPLFEAELRFPRDPFRPYEFRIAQSLVDLIQLPRRRAIGRAAFDAATLRVGAEVLRFGAEVRSNYYDVLAATQHVAMTRTIVEAARTAADLAMRQHQAQNITDLDLENEQALYEQAKLDLAKAEQSLLVARESLLRDLGLRSANAEWRVPETFPELPATELDQAGLEEMAATQRLDLAIVRREVEIAGRRVPAARLEALGEIVADVHFEREGDGARTVGPGIEFPIPIFNTGRAAKSRAEAEYLKARHLLSAIESEMASQLREARSVVAEARARVEYYRNVIVPRRQRIVELTKLEHNAMLVGTFQLLEAKKNELEARRDFIDAQHDYWDARTRLDGAVLGLASDMNTKEEH
jgi:outer membrane protein, heavy metal efflux system